MGTNADYQGRVEDDRFITGNGRYVADLAQHGLSHAVLVRSPYAHARLIDVDVTEAIAAPGVLGVFTATDLAADGIGDQPCGVTHPRPDGQEAFQACRRVLARDKVRHLGEPIALVVAESLAAAHAAAELVRIDVDELPVVTGSEAAKESGAALVWAEVPGNVACVWTRGDLDAVDAALAGAHHVARLDSQVSRVIAHTMEPRGVLAFVGDDGRLTVHASTQNPAPMRAGLAAMLGLPVDDIHVLAGDVGGSFGMKSGVYPEDVLVCWAARKVGRPVRWIADRSEGFLADEHGRDVHIRSSLGLDVDGHFLALRVECDINIGAYLSGRSLGMVGNAGGIAGIYRIGGIAAEIRAIHTHTQVTAPYRGAGRPEATYAIERVIDIAAREMNIDPFELRRRNVVPPSAMPYDTGFTFTYDSGEFEQNMLQAARMADRDGFEARRREASERGKLRGLGMANPIEAAGGPVAKPAGDKARLQVAPDGTVTLFSGCVTVGQGIETTFSNMVAEALGVDLAQVKYLQGDTDLLSGGRGNGGSSAAPVGAPCISITIDNLIEAGLASAAEMLQAELSDVTFADGCYLVADTDRSVGLVAVAAFMTERGSDGLTATGAFDPLGVTFPNGSHLCEVEIDPETGTIEVVNYCVCEDIGRVLNPTLAAGQMHGGIVQGAGQALLEQTVHDPDTGQLLTGSFMDYAMPRADNFPHFQFATREVLTPVNPLGVKGVGEAGSVGSIAATINAVCDALAPLGIYHFEMPATPARIWSAIQAVKS